MSLPTFLFFWFPTTSEYKLHTAAVEMIFVIWELSNMRSCIGILWPKNEYGRKVEINPLKTVTYR